MLSFLLLKCDTRVDDLVQNITDEVHDDNQRRQYDGGTHDQRVIAVCNAVDKGATDARDREDLLDDERVTMYASIGPT